MDKVVVDVEEREADSLAVATLAVSFSFFSFLSFFPFLLFCSLYFFNFLYSFQVCPTFVRGLCFAHQVHLSSFFFSFSFDLGNEDDVEED